MALRLRHTADRWGHLETTNYVVMSGEVVIGRIMRLDGGPQAGSSLWTRPT
jgi:hypothetical protein